MPPEKVCKKILDSSVLRGMPGMAGAQGRARARWLLQAFANRRVPALGGRDRALHTLPEQRKDHSSMTKEQKEIITMLRCVSITDANCETCCVDIVKCRKMLIDDIEQAAAETIEQLCNELDEVKKERDALLHDLHGNCYRCAHKSDELECVGCYYDDHWVWRGVCEDNGGNDNDD